MLRLGREFLILVIIDLLDVLSDTLIKIVRLKSGLKTLSLQVGIPDCFESHMARCAVVINGLKANFLVDLSEASLFKSFAKVN